MTQRITYNVHTEKKLNLERLAIEASLKLGRTVKWTEIMDILITEFGKDAQAHLLHKESKNIKNKNT